MADINSTNLSTEAPDFSMLALFMQADLVVKSVTVSYTHLTLPTSSRV